MREQSGARRIGSAGSDATVAGPRHGAAHFPIFVVREWAARFYEQDRLRRETVWWQLVWPFAVALVLAVGAAAVALRWRPHGPDAAFGSALLLSAAAIGMTVGGLLRLRALQVRRAAARAHPATVEELPRSARAAVLDSPRLRFRRPEDGASFAALRDEVAATAPVGQFAAAVLVWALVMQDSGEGTLEDWVRGRHL